MPGLRPHIWAVDGLGFGREVSDRLGLLDHWLRIRIIVRLYKFWFDLTRQDAPDVGIYVFLAFQIIILFLI